MGRCGLRESRAAGRVYHGPAGAESTGDGYTMRDKKDLFYLDDGTGRILVDPSGATINAERGTFGIALHLAILKQFTKKKSFPESRLMPGDTVHLVGSVQVNREGNAYDTRARNQRTETRYPSDHLLCKYAEEGG